MDENDLTQSQSRGFAPRSIIYLGWLFMASFLCIASYYFDKAANSVVFCTITYTVIVLVHLARIFVREDKVDWLAPDLLFLLVYSGYHYGYIIPYVLGLIPYDTNVFVFPKLMPFTLFLINLGLVSFLIAYEFGLPAQRAALLQTGPKYVSVPPMGWFVIAWSIMITGLAFHFGTLAQVPAGSLLADTYYVVSHIDEYVSTPVFFNISDRVFLLGAAIYVATSIYRTGKLFASKLGMVVILGFLIFSLLEGDRGGALKLGVVVLCAMWYGVRRIKLKWLIVIFIITTFSIGAVRVLRHTAGLDIGKIPQEYKYQKERRPYPLILETSAELGGTVRTVNGSVGFLHENYWWGRSLVQAFAGTITRKITANLGPSPSEWLTTNLQGIRAPGAGSSIVAEGYLNLGILGVILVMFAVGYLLRWFYFRLRAYPGPINMILLLVALSSCVYWVRQNSELAIPVFIRALIFCGLLRLFLSPRYLPWQQQSYLVSGSPSEDVQAYE